MNTKNKYVCEKCDITCNKLSKWNRHIQTVKHIQLYSPEKQFACSKCKKEKDFVNFTKN